MVLYEQGDLFASGADVLVNTVNLVGIMGKGIALQFRHAFPNNFAQYKSACQKHELKIGTLLIATDHNLMLGEKIIINFPTKTHWRLPSEYHYVEAGLAVLKEYLLKQPQQSLAMPAPGCGNGGLDFVRVRMLIETYLAFLPNQITIYIPF